VPDEPLSGRLRRRVAHTDQRRRLLAAGPCGVAAGAIVGLVGSWQLAVLVGWDVAALLFDVSVWLFLPVLDAADTERVSTREDDSRAAVDIIVVASSLVSLVGVVVGLAQAGNRQGATAAVLTVVAVLTVLVSWVTVQTLFTLRYARLYYTPPSGGIAFGETDEPPDYLDFAYLAFTVGMTFQVSDTDIASRAVRRTVLRHALLSYVYGTVIVGVTINVLGSLVG
jgi:uncharacterized membrane protein